MFNKYLMGLALSVVMHTAFAAPPKIAVTDLTYEEKVSEYFRVVSASSKSNVNSKHSESETEKRYSGRGSYNGSHESQYSEVEGYYTYIEQGELRKYTADLKGEMIKGGGVKLVQARPYKVKEKENIFDIISRIKQGYYPGADYVLFGTVSQIEFRAEKSTISSMQSTASLLLDLAVDFSLINTKTFEVSAAFSALGSGVDTKILSNPGDQVAFSRAKVISETSKSLAESAYAELINQFRVTSTGRIGSSEMHAPTPGKIAPKLEATPVVVY